MRVRQIASLMWVPACMVPLWPHQASLSMGFSRLENWSGFPRPPPGDLPRSEMRSTSPALANVFITTTPPLGSPMWVSLIQLVGALNRTEGANFSPGKREFFYLTAFTLGHWLFSCLWTQTETWVLLESWATGFQTRSTPLPLVLSLQTQTRTKPYILPGLQLTDSPCHFWNLLAPIIA